MPESAVAEAPVDTSFVDKLDAARAAARVLATVTTEQKNRALRGISAAIVRNADRILPANELDLVNAAENGMSEGMQDRLRLDFRRLEALEEAVLQIVSLEDPIGETVRGSKLPNGLNITQVRVPFGVVGAIYEARPNVTVDIAALALKSGNAVVRRAAPGCDRRRGSSG
jgi:glutamate-5-semialdehyde dehydrogenase